MSASALTLQYASPRGMSRIMDLPLMQDAMAVAWPTSLLLIGSGDGDPITLPLLTVFANGIVHGTTFLAVYITVRAIKTHLVHVRRKK